MPYELCKCNIGIVWLVGGLGYSLKPLVRSTAVAANCGVAYLKVWSLNESTQRSVLYECETIGLVSFWIFGHVNAHAILANFTTLTEDFL